MNAPNLDLQFHALSDATRRALVERLSHGPTSVTELAEPMAVSLPTVLKHLAILEAGSIVISEKQGRVRTFRVAPDAFADLERWMDERKRLWNRRFDKLEQYLDGESS
jgi:DNA-binding transcriptional ArsR family regulator